MQSSAACLESHRRQERARRCLGIGGAQRAPAKGRLASRHRPQRLALAGRRPDGQGQKGENLEKGDR